MCTRVYVLLMICKPFLKVFFVLKSERKFILLHWTKCSIPSRQFGTGASKNCVPNEAVIHSNEDGDQGLKNVTELSESWCKSCIISLRVCIRWEEKSTHREVFLSLDFPSENCCVQMEPEFLHWHDASHQYLSISSISTITTYTPSSLLFFSPPYLLPSVI